MPKLGLLSDSHGKARLTAKAVELLQKNGAQVLFHMGDVGGVQVVDALVVSDNQGNQVPVHLTWGNLDDQRPDLLTIERYARALGVQIYHPEGSVQIGNVKIGITHGHVPGAIQRLVDQKCHYVLHGHTHEKRDVDYNGTRLINPGALHRVEVVTVAVLDTVSGKCQFFELPRE